jgi:AcrR family transcriptional regulator
MQYSRQAERSSRTRDRVLRSTVDLIRREGLSSASPVKIAQHTGLSWGAVQHHFGSKEQLLRRIVLASRDEFNAAVVDQNYAGLDLDQRISLFVDSAWRHYQSDVFLASVEITFWHRNRGIMLAEDVSGDDGRTSALARTTMERVFAGTGADTDGLMEAMVYMHCVLTGLAFQDILGGSNDQLVRHLAHCKRAMAEIVAGTGQ